MNDNDQADIDEFKAAVRRTQGWAEMLWDGLSGDCNPLDEQEAEADKKLITKFLESM